MFNIYMNIYVTTKTNSSIAFKRGNDGKKWQRQLKKEKEKKSQQESATDPLYRVKSARTPDLRVQKRPRHLHAKWERTCKL